MNGDKCQFRLPKLTFLGHDLSKQGVAPSEEKVAAILNANPLQDASQVRSFVQLVQYSAKFLPNFAQEAEPLRSLLRKNEPFIWGEAQERSFQKLKQLVAQATTLAYFREDCNTRIIADAGPQGLGAVLSQLQDGEWRAISYASRNFTEVERRYSQTEKDALALAQYGLVRVSTFMCTGANFNLKLITSHSSVFLAGYQNHQHVSNVGF